jgi:predicted signal transduction protein with EAL and GGDEF domain
LSHPLTDKLTQACLNAALQPFELANGTASIGASIGVVQVNSPENFDSALARADEAMYSIKKNGKCGVALSHGEGL